MSSLLVCLMITKKQTKTKKVDDWHSETSLNKQEVKKNDAVLVRQHKTFVHMIVRLCIFCLLIEKGVCIENFYVSIFSNQNSVLFNLLCVLFLTEDQLFTV